MAKKGTAIRVFQLAKELGVASKDIIAKCEAEDIPGITNHMSAVSLGLAATIREWFGDGADEAHTAVESAAPVDVSAARAKATTKKKAAKKKATARKKSAKKTDPEPEAATATAVAEPESTEQDAEVVTRTTTPPPAKSTSASDSTTAKSPAKAAPAEPAVETPAAADGPEPAPPQDPATDDVPRVAAEAPSADQQGDTMPGDDLTDDAGKPVMNVPQRPDVITPAGPKLQQPTKTKLTGPRVVRVETPEVIPPKRPRGNRWSGGGGGGGGGGAGAGAGAGIMPPGGPMPSDQDRGRGSSRRNKRRSSAARDDSGRSARAFQQDENRNWREQDLKEREQRLRHAGGFLRAARRDNLKRSTGQTQRAQTAAETGGSVTVEEPITIKSLSAATGVKAADILKTLFMAGKPTTINAAIDSETATEVMLEYNIDLKVVEQKTAEQQIVEQFESRDMVDEQARGPVITILGHVDHGKTTLLDSIRNTRVAEGEAGGITQATSAFRVPVTVGDEDRMITFIDTPGHEAFTEMRSRGAKMTDIVVLVVAADDGVMPQTIESINHAKAAEVPIIVALNKIDKAEATDSNIQRILGQLAEHELNPVEWGGDTEVVRVAALKGEGITDLLEVIDLQAQILELAADFGGRAEGTVIEAQREEGRGPVARILVQQGKLAKGDHIVIGRAFGRVRDITNDQGQRIDEAGPSVPVAISGINDLPDGGDKFYIVKNLRDAESAADERRQQERERDLASEKVTLDNIFEKLSESQRKELPLIIKADVQGSLETLRATIEKIRSDEVAVAIKHSAVGGVNESDITLAEASGAIVIGFNVSAAPAARKAAESKGIDIRFYDVIYDLTDDVTKAAEGLLDPELKLEVLGHAEVRDVFKISKVGMVAGCYVTDGVVQRNALIRVTRDEIVIEKNRKLEQLKRFKDDAKEVKSGQECGMKIEGYDDIKPGDVLECYLTKEVRRSLETASA